MGPQRKRLNHQDYTIGWICALTKELTVAIAMLDEEHERLLPASDRDENTYVFGEIGDHNVVIAGMPMGMTGNAPAALVAKDLLHSFRHLQFYLMVGIGGGAPHRHNDIRLGDVVVSAPTGHHGGVVQYDFGKTVADGVFHRTGTLNRPPSALLSRLSYLRSSYELLGRPNFLRHLSAARARYPHRAAAFSYPSELSDILFKADYDHARHHQPCKAGCDHRRIVRRPPRPNNDPSVFFGNIASANQVMRHGLTRDRIAREHNVLCFEMEAAGLMDQFSCLVIRGISDYSDTHKNDEWQDYASAVAAAFAKDLLLVIPARAPNGGLPRRSDTESLHFDTPPTDTHDEEDIDRQNNGARSNYISKTGTSPSRPDATQATARSSPPPQRSTDLATDETPLPRRSPSYPHDSVQESLTNDIPPGLPEPLQLKLSSILARPPFEDSGVVYICDAHIQTRKDSDTRVIKIGFTTSDVYQRVKSRPDNCASTRLRLITFYPRSQPGSHSHKHIRNVGQVERLICAMLWEKRYVRDCPCKKRHHQLFEIGEHEMDNVLHMVEHWVSWSERKFGNVWVPRRGNAVITSMYQ